jgi:hypothetical protein
MDKDAILEENAAKRETIHDAGDKGKTNATNASTSTSGNGKGTTSTSTYTVGSISRATCAGASALMVTKRWIDASEVQEEGVGKVVLP